jgi:hypothetical protein
MNRNHFIRALPLAALMMLWVAGSGLWAQVPTPALPGAVFQPASPDAPLPKDAPAAEAASESAAQQAEPPEQPGTEPASESAAQQAEAPEQPGTEPASESAAQQAEAPAMESKEAPEAAATAQEDKPWSENELSNTYQPHPTAVRVAVLDASGRSRGAGLIAFLLEEYRRKELERKIGKLITVVNQSRLMNIRLKNSIISYRPGNLRAALIMADVIPGKQYVVPIVPESTPKIGVDVEIRVGTELP